MRSVALYKRYIIIIIYYYYETRRDGEGHERVLTFKKWLGTKTYEGEMIERSRETTEGREEGGVKIECLRNEDLSD